MLLGLGLGVPFQTSKGVLVFDSFNRADNAASMGNADTGQSWQVLSGTWGISSNKAYLASVTSQASTVVNAGVPGIAMTSDVTLSSTLNRAAPGLVVRTIDDSNYLLATITKASTNDLIEIYKRDLGVFTQLAQLVGAGNVNGTTYSVRVTAIGNTISVYRDGVLKLSHTLVGADATKFATPTLCGIRVHNSATGDDGLSRFDNISVEAI